MHFPRNIGLLVLAVAASLAASSPVPTTITPTSSTEMINKAACGPHEFCQFGTSTATAKADPGNPLGFPDFPLGHFGDHKPPVKAKQTTSPIEAKDQAIETTATANNTLIR